MIDDQDRLETRMIVEDMRPQMENPIALGLLDIFMQEFGGDHNQTAVLIGALATIIENDNGTAVDLIGDFVMKVGSTMFIDEDDENYHGF